MVDLAFSLSYNAVVSKVIRWVYSTFGDWLSDRINGILWSWVGACAIQAFNLLGWYDATFALMKFEQLSEMLDVLWYIDTVFSGLTVILWFFRKAFGQHF